jgi:hypothetical protein
MSTSIELAFAESAVVSYSVVRAPSALRAGTTAASGIARPSVSLLHGSAQSCGVPLALFRPLSLGCASDGAAATVVDCVAEGGCRLQLSAGASAGFYALSIRRVPLACNAVQHLVARVRDARAAAKAACRAPPRCLVVGFGDGAASWCSSYLLCAAVNDAAAPTIYVDASLRTHEVRVKDGAGGQNSVLRAVPAGCVTVQFLEPAADVQQQFHQRRCLELFTFYVGTGDAAASDAEDALAEVLSTVNDMLVRASSSSIELASACVVVNLGEFVPRQQQNAAPAHDRVRSFLPKVLRLLRVTHLVALIGPKYAAASALQDALDKAVTSVVHGVVLEKAFITWPPAIAQQQHQLQQQPHSDGNGDDSAALVTVAAASTSERLAHSDAVQRYLFGPATDRRDAVFRLVLDVATAENSKGSVRLLDAKTLQPITSLARLRPYALCAVVSPSAGVAEKVATAQSTSSAAVDAAAAPTPTPAVHPALLRVVVGFVVIVDVGSASSVVVLSPTAGDLPCNTLLVGDAATAGVDPDVLPGVLETN